MITFNELSSDVGLNECFFLSEIQSIQTNWLNIHDLNSQTKNLFKKKRYLCGDGHKKCMIIIMYRSTF